MGQGCVIDAHIATASPLSFLSRFPSSFSSFSSGSGVPGGSMGACRNSSTRRKLTFPVAAQKAAGVMPSLLGAAASQPASSSISNMLRTSKSVSSAAQRMKSAGRAFLYGSLFGRAPMASRWLTRLVTSLILGYGGRTSSRKGVVGLPSPPSTTPTPSGAASERRSSRTMSPCLKAQAVASAETLVLLSNARDHTARSSSTHLYCPRRQHAPMTVLPLKTALGSTPFRHSSMTSGLAPSSTASKATGRFGAEDPSYGEMGLLISKAAPKASPS